MAWKVTNAVDERFRFVLEDRAGESTFAELCRNYGISRKTGYKWRERFGENPSPTSLVDMPRVPNTSPLETPTEMALEIVRLRHLHPFWGPLKIEAILRRTHPPGAVPRPRTVARILERAGLIEKRRRIRGCAPGRLKQAIVPEKPNDLWTTDFKGWWRTKDRQKCEPFTLRDDWSRFILAAYPMTSNRSELVMELMTDIFRRYGLPLVIRSDNGPPFANALSPLGLTRLSVWWLALGIRLHRIQPGKPQQNGSHERPHLDIKKEIQWKPEDDLDSQRIVLEDWRQVFNQVRPHQALEQRTPAEFYEPSPRVFPEGSLQVTYPASFESRRVTPTGYVKFRNTSCFITEALAGWDIGIQRLPDRLQIWFTDVCLGETDLGWSERIRPLND